MSDLRAGIVRLWEEGKKQSEIARDMNVPKQTVSDAIKRFRETGHNEDRAAVSRNRLMASETVCFGTFISRAISLCFLKKLALNFVRELFGHMTGIIYSALSTMASIHEYLKKMYMPEIEKVLTADQNKQFHAIVENPNSTKQQIKDGLKAFFTDIGGTAGANFSEIEKTIEARRAEFGATVKEAEGKLSPETKELLGKSRKIKEDMTLTHQQERQQFETLFNGVSDKIKNELKALGGPFKPEFGLIK